MTTNNLPYAVTNGASNLTHYLKLLMCETDRKVDSDNISEFNDILIPAFEAVFAHIAKLEQRIAELEQANAPQEPATLPDNERDYWWQCDSEQTIIVHDKWHGNLVQVDGVELYVNRAVEVLFAAYGANKIAIRPTNRDWTILTDEDVQEVRNARAEWKAR